MTTRTKRRKRSRRNRCGDGESVHRSRTIAPLCHSRDLSWAVPKESGNPDFTIKIKEEDDACFLFFFYGVGLFTPRPPPGRSPPAAPSVPPRCLPRPPPS